MIVQNTYPVNTAIPLSVAKLHLKVDSDDEDYLINEMIKAATSYAEKYTNRVLLERTFTAYFDEVQDIEINRWPISSIDSVKYINSSGTLTTLVDGTDYFTDIKSCPARVKIVTTLSIQTNVLNGLQVNFTAGESDYRNIERGITKAMLILIGDMYEQRQSMASNFLQVSNFTADKLFDLFIKGEV